MWQRFDNLLHAQCMDWETSEVKQCSDSALHDEEYMTWHDIYDWQWMTETCEWCELSKLQWNVIILWLIWTTILIAHEMPYMNDSMTCHDWYAYMNI